MSLPFNFNYKNPDYLEVFDYRTERLNRIRKTPSCLPDLKNYYRENPIAFINDWGMTYEPRNIPKGLPAFIPLILMEYQEDKIINPIMEQWKAQKPLIIDKSRDMGVTVVFMSLISTLSLFIDGFSAGVGSRKAEYVDGDLKALLPKARFFLENLPEEFRGGWERRKHSKENFLIIPETSAVIVGESGDGIGRGDRKSMYGVDESASLERPHLTDASLASATDCRVDLSTPRGPNNSFAKKVRDGIIRRESLHWTIDARKDQAWYDAMCAALNFDKVVIAQELDIDYSASVEGIMIPAVWVLACLDAHIKLDIKPSGQRVLAFDVADRGMDLCAAIGRYGFLIEYAEDWSGKGDDIYGSVERVVEIANAENYGTVVFDADGLGAGVRGDARKLNEKQINKIEFIPFHGSGKVVNPEADAFPPRDDQEKEIHISRLNQDYYLNLKAQGWGELRNRALETYRAVVMKLPYDPEKILSISSKIPNHQKLMLELSQPIHKQNGNGKIMIDKTPENMKSPNLGDGVMMAFAPREEIPWTSFDARRLNYA